MGNYSMILVLTATVVVSAIALNTRSSTRTSDRVLHDHTLKFVARQAAHTGLNVTGRRLAADTLSWSLDPSKYAYTDEPFQTATFSSQVFANYGPTIKLNKCFIDTVDVAVVGRVGEVEHRIEAVYVRSCSEDGASRHEAFGYPLVTDQDLLVEQQLKVKSGTDSTNAGIHANQTLTGYGNPYVEGYGTYTVPGGECSDCANFLPNNDVNGDDPNVFQAPEIPLWTFDPTDYLEVATYVERSDVRFRRDDVTIDFTNFMGITGYGTADNPFIYYVPGNIQFDTNVNFIGYGLIVTEGWVEVTDNGNIYANIPSDVTPPPSNTDNPNTEAVRDFMNQYLSGGSSLALAIGGSKGQAGEDISLYVKGRSTVMGTVFMNGGVDIPGDATFYGSLTAMDDMVMDGKTMIWYNGASRTVEDLLARVLNAPEGIRLLDFAEW
jgi:hypothetical protein